MKDIKCPACIFGIESAGNVFPFGDQMIGICPACQARVVMTGPDAGNILKTLETVKLKETEDTDPSETYEIYYRDYREKKTHFLGFFPERRKNPKRDRSLASIARWGRFFFKGTVKDLNGIFVLRKISHQRPKDHGGYERFEGSKRGQMPLRKGLAYPVNSTYPIPLTGVP